MRLCFTPHGWEDYTYWQRTDRATLKRVNRLIDDALRDPLADRQATAHGVVEGEFHEVQPPARLVPTFQNHLQTLEVEDLEKGAEWGFARIDAVLEKLLA